MLVYLLSAIETDEDRALFVDLFEKYHDRMEQAAVPITLIQLIIVALRVQRLLRRSTGIRKRSKTS